MTLLSDVKRRLGVYYSEANKDAEIQSMIDGATQYFKGAGWDISTPDALATEAVVLYCKMAQNTDPTLLVNHPVLLSFIAQGRTLPLTVATPSATPDGGAYATAQEVTLECATEDAEIYYTIDGSDPNEEDGTLYYTPIEISATTTVKARAYKYGRYDSAIMTETYTI